MSRKPISHIDTAELDAALASLRERILASESFGIDCEQGRVEVPTMGFNREFKPGAVRITIMINEHLGGLDGTGELSADDYARCLMQRSIADQIESGAADPR